MAVASAEQVAAAVPGDLQDDDAKVRREAAGLEACELLSGTGLTVTEIALRVGFFLEKFSELIGVSPREDRKRFKAGA